MAEEISGRSDQTRILQLLWGKTDTPKRGPKPKVALSDIVAAAVIIADAEGLEAVSTRRVAEAAGVSAMSFYTHVQSKAELLDLMLDHVSGAGSVPPPEWPQMDWRARMTLVAESLWQHYLTHPWVLQIETHRPVLGPNTMAAYEVALSAVADIGLDEIEMDLAITSLANYVTGAVRNAARAQTVKELTGMSDDQWWHAVAPFFETLDYSAYPLSARVGSIAGETYGLGDPGRAFRFGLDRLLDGMELMIARKVSTRK
ncbi:TetR/AcrR family transcriptional regulator [Pelagibacterium limicola]|uniref:TetR/AcrR family transcriptional regulator n=1 Tax=Pelagibacterium limicola TaxID=2791022 RepID=UPI0018B0090D|nr:TetR/AcrR family transcriptional regulator [Pelagibacterium limicola]